MDNAAVVNIISPQGVMRDRVEGLCGQIDASRGV